VRGKREGILSYRKMEAISFSKAGYRGRLELQGRVSLSLGKGPLKTFSLKNMESGKEDIQEDSIGKSPKVWDDRRSERVCCKLEVRQRFAEISRHKGTRKWVEDRFAKEEKG